MKSRPPQLRSKPAPHRRDFMSAAVATGGLAAASLSQARAASLDQPGDMPPDLPPGQAGRLEVPDWPHPSEVIPLWPKGAPGNLNPDRVEIVEERSKTPDHHDRAVHGITHPRLCAFPAFNPNGGAILITPGGGYGRIVLDHEGYQLAHYLNGFGLSVFVLFYRLPAEGWDNRADVPLMDAQRAMRVIRSQAKRFAIDPNRVASMGFSAGGHVCASLMTRYDATVYAPVDPADQLSAKPCLAAPLYPVQSLRDPYAHKDSRLRLLGDAPLPSLIDFYSPDQTTRTDLPPTFLLHAEDDTTVPVENTIRLRQTLKTAGIQVETHLFAQGGHGFGIGRQMDKPVHNWPELFLRFARNQGLMG